MSIKMSIKCPYCDTEFESHQALGGHVGKKHHVKREVFGVRINRELKDWYIHHCRKRGLSSCHLIETWIASYRRYVELGHDLSPNLPPTIAVYQTFLGKPRSKYKCLVNVEIKKKGQLKLDDYEM